MKKYVIFNPEGGIGKIIASTGVIKFIQQKYPEHKIIVVTPWPEVYLNNPRVHRVFRPSNAPYFYKDYIEGKETIILKGEPYYHTEHLQNQQHVIQSWCNLHGLPFDGSIKPELYFTRVEQDFYNSNTLGDKPFLLLQTGSGSYKDNKQYSWERDIPPTQAQALVNELSKDYEVLHFCTENSYQLSNVNRISEVPNKRVFLSFILKTQKRLLINSCFQHAAAALNLKSTVCWITTSPKVFGYDMHDNIFPVEEKMRQYNGAGIDNFLFSYDLQGHEYEFPFSDYQIFNLQEVYDSLTQNEATDF
jgi:hypothetical protein